MNDYPRDPGQLREEEEAAIEREFNPDSAALVDYLGGELTPAQAAEVEERLANDPDFREMAEPLMFAWNALPKAPAVSAEEVADAWHDVRRRAGLPALPEAHGIATMSAARRRLRVDWRRAGRALALAAGIVGLVSVPSLWLWRAQQRVATIRTSNVMTTSVVLPDGSRARLAEGTTIRYPKAFAERRIELVGEARFDVVHSGSSFSVVTGTAVVTVTGTSFTVQAYERQPAEITVHEGSVRVESRRAPGSATTTSLSLTAGQRARVPGLSPPERLP